MKPLFLILLTLILNLSLTSQNIQPQKLKPGEWITEWLLLGPVRLQENTDPAMFEKHLPGFETDYLKKWGGEENLRDCFDLFYWLIFALPFGETWCFGDLVA